jgi:hypothetical protein
MSFNQKLYDELCEKRASGVGLRPAEKAELSKLEKELRRSNKPAQEDKQPETNILGAKNNSDNEKSPKLIRFVQVERRALKTRRESLLADSPDDVKEALGSVKAASEDLLVRAAVLSLSRLSDKKLIALMKEAQMNS